MGALTSNKDFSNSPVAIVTGASGGVGASIAKALASKGDRVVVNYLNSESRALGLVHDIELSGGCAVAQRADVTDGEGCRRLAEWTLEKCGRIDILVNNAGLLRETSLYSTSAQDWTDTLSCNILGVSNTAAACAPYMVGPNASITNIGSLAGIYTSSQALPYSVSKAGVIALTRCLAAELGPVIRVNCVAPGFMETAMTAHYSHGAKLARANATVLKRLCSPEDVADAVLFLAHHAPYITGQTLILDGGMFLY